VTLIQRFGSALNLNIHFHMLLLDGRSRAFEIPIRASAPRLWSRTFVGRDGATIRADPAWLSRNSHGTRQFATAQSLALGFTANCAVYRDFTG
jgi:hypothetical protein